MNDKTHFEILWRCLSHLFSYEDVCTIYFIQFINMNKNTLLSSMVGVHISTRYQAALGVLIQKWECVIHWPSIVKPGFNIINLDIHFHIELFFG